MRPRASNFLLALLQMDDEDVGQSYVLSQLWFQVKFQ